MDGSVMQLAWRELDNVLVDATDVYADSSRPASERDAAFRAIEALKRLRDELRPVRSISDRELPYLEDLAGLQREMIAIAQLDDEGIRKRGGASFSRAVHVCAHVARTIDNQLLIERSPVPGQ